MASIFDILAEQRISDAIKRGELDHLPGAGRPLVFDDDPFVSPEQRMTNHILKNAGFVPQEVLLRREIASLRHQLAEPESNEEERERVRRRLGYLIATLGSLRRR